MLRRFWGAICVLPVATLLVVGFVVVSAARAPHVASRQGKPLAATAAGAPNPLAVPASARLLAQAQRDGLAWARAEAMRARQADPRASRVRYLHESSAQALGTARTFFPHWLTRPLESTPPLAAGQRIAHYIGTHRAEILGGGRRAVALSSLPLIGTTPSGERAPINLNVERAGSGYQARATATPVAFPPSAAGKLRFLKQGFAIGLGGGSASRAAESGGRLFYGDATGAAGAVDALVQATPTGAELSWIFRNGAASLEQPIPFSLPAGGHLVIAGPRPGAQSVKVDDRNGHPLAMVLPAIATDAVGQPVQASYSLQGVNTLILRLHPGPGTVFPILADPLVAAWSSNLYSSWGTSYSGHPGEFNFSQSSGYSFDVGQSWCPSACNTNWGEYYYNSLPGAYIYEEYVNGVYNVTYDTEEYAGIFGPGGGSFPAGTWRMPGMSSAQGPYAFRYDSQSESATSTDYCVAGTSSGSNGGCPTPAFGAVQPNNIAVAGGMYYIGPTGAAIPSVAVYGAWLYESDSIRPTVSVSSHSGYTPGSWSKTFTDNVIVAGNTNNGSGQYGLGYAATAIGTNTTSPWASPIVTNTACGSSVCAGSYSQALTYNSTQLPEGSYNVCAQGKSAVGNLGNVACWPVAIDRTAPAPPSVTGIANNGVYGATPPTLTITPSDPPGAGANASSGPASTAVAVDGGAPISLACTNQCTWPMPSSLTEGSHTVAFTTTDGAGNPGPSTKIGFVVDRTPPTNSISGPAFDAGKQNTASGTQALAVTASDSSASQVTAGATSIRTYVDGSLQSGAPSASQACPAGNCSLSASGQINFDALSAGPHVVEVQATDAVGNLATSHWIVVVGATQNAVSRTLQGCWTGATAPTMAAPRLDDLSDVFDGLSLSDVSLVCNPDPAQVAANNDDSGPATVPYLNLSYGTCTPQTGDEGGCADPLDVQFWPECARNEMSYAVPDGQGGDLPMANTDIDLSQLVPPLLASVRSALPQEAWEIPTALTTSLTSGLQSLPTASYENGTRIELYAGGTTIVVFADDPTVANLAIAALALKLEADGGISASASVLASQAMGNGCFS